MAPPSRQRRNTRRSARREATVISAFPRAWFDAQWGEYRESFCIAATKALAAQSAGSYVAARW